MAEPRLAEPVQAAPAGTAARVAAALAIRSVLDLGQSLDDALDRLPTFAEECDRSLVHELCYGVLRTFPRQEALAEALLHKPLKRQDGDLKALILIGLYQLANTRIPPHAAVAATVESARALGKDWAAPLINALLRRFQREHEQLLARADRSPEVRWLFPRWLLQRLQAAWPDHWQEIIAASNGRAPMTLRVNTTKVSREQYSLRLGAAGLSARPTAEAATGITLDRPVPVTALPGFEQGLVSVQDLGAQLAAALLDAKPGEGVLDACAAPGGKSAHILERAGNQLELTALDIEPARLDLVRDNLRRLGLSARVVQGDAAAPIGGWAQRRYHRILLDAPCSASGVIRRHPDIKWLRRESDVAALSKLQARMLDALWQLLLPGGTLLYVTCSLLPEENEEQIRAFLGRRSDARICPLEATWGVARSFGRQTLPREGGPDGFFYAALTKGDK